jgi:hypothetical protein
VCGRLFLEIPDDLTQAVWLIDIFGPMDCRKGKTPRRRAETGQDVRTRPDHVSDPEAHVVHHVSDDVDAGGNPLAREIRRGVVRGAEQQIAEVIRHDTVDLLGHASVERAQSGFDMSHRDV